MAIVTLGSNFRMDDSGALGLDDNTAQRLSVSGSGFSASDASGKLITLSGSGFVYDNTGDWMGGMAEGFRLSISGQTVLDIAGAAVTGDVSVYDSGYDGELPGMSSELAYWLRGDDVVSGTGGAEMLKGCGGNDALNGGAGDDHINGGSGTDTAIYSGSSSEYTISINQATHTATITDHQAGRNGTDTLVNVEKAQFANQTFDLFAPAQTQTPSYGHTSSFLFDSAYYLLSHPELASSVTVETADDHYLSTGAALGYEPNAWFDPAYYENRWSDLKALNLDDATLFQHYNLYGVWEGRSAGPRFDHYDGERYLRDNPDVAAYVDAHLADFLGSRSNGAIAHYVISGANEGRVAYDANGNLIDSAVLIGIAG